MKKCLILSLFCCLAVPNLAIAAPIGNALDVLLNSPSIPERRVAYLEIIKNPDAYSDQIFLGLVNWNKTSYQNINAFNKLVYLAALLKRSEFIEPLKNLGNDPEYRLRECIYSCPPGFALTAFVISKRWAPPDNAANHKNTYLEDLDFYKDKISLTKSHPRIVFALSEDQQLLSKTESLCEEELIKQAAPTNTDYKTRWLAAEVLGCTVMDDKNLEELYWLALEEMGGDDIFYRGSIYHAILRAEKARGDKAGHVLRP